MAKKESSQNLVFTFAPLQAVFRRPTRFCGTIEEHGHTVILGLRLKVENKKIGEMEVIAVCKTSGVFSEPQNLVDKPIFR
jgi:hypothetical protein